MVLSVKNDAMQLSPERADDVVSRAITFVLNGERYSLTTDDVSTRLAGIAPGPIQKHAVLVGSTWYPVRQAFGVATMISAAEYTSHTARRHLAALGFEVRGTIDARGGPRTGGRYEAGGAPSEAAAGSDETWHTEANVQAAVVAWLVAQGWQILSVADTATREHGVDIVARRGTERAGVEVKGYPSVNYADPARAHETKRTQPSTQAGHWYAQAVLAAMRLRGRQPDTSSVIALPDFSRYRTLYSETAGSLAASGIEVWWVESNGEVSTSRPDA